MDDKKEQLIRGVRSAAASIRMEGLPLSDEFIEEYLKKKLQELDKETKKKVLKKDIRNNDK
jgi:hypothetical protein